MTAVTLEYRLEWQFDIFLSDSPGLTIGKLARMRIASS